MDLNESQEFTPFAASATPIHHFRPMNPIAMPYHQPPKEARLIVHPAQIYSDGEYLMPSDLLLRKRHLEMFWKQQMMDIQNISVSKNQHQLPLARVKRIMKADKDVKMISSDTPVLLSKACEILIKELTLRACLKMEEFNRRTLMRVDIARAIRHVENFDFLADIISVNENKDGYGKIPNKNECHPVNELFPPEEDVNPDLFLRDPDVQQFMLNNPPMLSDNFNSVNRDNGNDGP